MVVHIFRRDHRPSRRRVATRPVRRGTPSHAASSRRLGVESLERRMVLNGSPLTTLQFQIPAAVAGRGVQFGFWGTGGSGQQYMTFDQGTKTYTFANLSTLAPNTQKLPLLSLSDPGTYTTTQTVSVPVPNVSNVSSGLVFFVGPVTNGIGLNLDSKTGDVLSVSTPAPNTAGSDVYGLFELDNAGTSNLDVDISNVDQFGIPFSADFLQADGKTPITTMYPYNQGVGTLPSLDRQSIFDAFRAQHPPTDPFGIVITLGNVGGVQARLVSPHTLCTVPDYEDQLGTLGTHFDNVLKRFFDYYQKNTFTYVQSQQAGPGSGTVWEGRVVTKGIPSDGSGPTVDPTSTFGVRALQLTGQSGIRAININPGANGNGSYTSAPTVTIDPPPAGGVRATATAIMAGSTGKLSVAAVRIDNPGSGYTTVPTVSFTGGGGSGAAATATINEFPNAVVNVFDPLSVQAKATNLPTWMTNDAWNETLPSAMVFGAMKVFASNAVDPGVNTPNAGTANAGFAAHLPVALGNIENVIATAFVRGIATMPSQTAKSPADPTQPALLSPQQWLAGTSYQTFSWKKDPQGQNQVGGTLAPNTTYYYAVTTVDPAGNETVPSRIVSTSLGASQNAAKLEWLPLGTQLVARYRIYRGDSPTTLRLVGAVENVAVPSPTTSFVDGTQTPPPGAGSPLPYIFYRPGRKFDAYSKFLHERFINGLGYGNPYDDQGNFSTNIGFPPSGQPPIIRIAINDWSSTERFGVSGPKTATAGTSFTATVTAEAGDVLTFSSSDPQAVLPKSQTFNPGTPTVPVTFKTSGKHGLTVTSNSGREAVLKVDVSPAAPAALGFVGQPGFQFVNRPFAEPVSVQIQDAYGNRVKHGGDGVGLAFRSANGATLLGTTSTNTDANGLATFPSSGPGGLAVNKAGNYVLVASYTGTSLGSLTAGASRTFSISQVGSITFSAPLTVAAGASFQMTVTGPDRYLEDTVTFAAQGAGVQVVDADGLLQPLAGFRYTFKPSDQGTKTFTVSITGAAGQRTLSAVSSTLSTVSGSKTVTVLSAPHQRRVRLFAR